MSNRFLFTLVGITLLTLSSSLAHAQKQIVVPPYLSSTEGNLSWSLSSAGVTIQQLFGSSLLTGLSVGDQITGISFRLDGGATSNTGATFTNFDIQLGQSNFAVGSLSENVAGNQAADTVLVRSGALTMGAYTGGAAANPFGPVITFSTPYTYKGGDLLITFSHSGTSGGMIWDATFNSSDPIDYRQSGEYNQATLGNRSSGYALIPRFQATAAVVPEANTAALLGFTLPIVAGAVVVRRRGK